MKDRVPGAPGRYQAVITAAELQKMQSGEQFAITMKRDDQPLVEGTPYSKAAVLPDSVAGQLCPDINDPTPADALKSLADKSAKLQNNKADNVHQASGAVIAIHNSGNSPLHGLKVFGKTTQNGTPSPENPVELVSVGGSGAINILVEDQSLPSSTPNGLPGIPVSSGGNYTDENGQQWICDEVDYVKGKYIQRIWKKVFDGTESLAAASVNRPTAYMYGIPSVDVSKWDEEQQVMCSHFRTLPYADANKAEDNTIAIYPSYNGFVIRFIYDAGEVPAFLAAQYAAGYPVVVHCVLTTPVETDLTAEELAQYAALHTNKPNTTIYNDAGAYMELEYYTPLSALPEGGGRMGGNIDMAGYRVSGLGTPANPDDAINLGYANGAYAPAGYGYGEAAPNIGSFSTEADLETALSTVAAGMGALESKQFCFTLKIYGGYFYAAVIYKRTDSQFLVSAIAYSSCIQFYKRYDNGWQPLEWANPPMSPGIEYRTTERWAGAPVYTMLIEAGAIPNASRSSIAYPNGIVPNQVLRVCGQNHNGETIPRKWGDGEIWVSASRSYIYIETNTDLWSTYAALVQVWYTR